MHNETEVRYSRGYLLLKDDPAPSEENVARWLTLLNDTAVELAKKIGVAVVIDDNVVKAVIAVWRKRGLPYCPCRPGVSDPRYVCPCVEVEDGKSILLRKRCTCGLFRVVM